MGNLNTYWLSKCYLFRADKFMCKAININCVITSLRLGVNYGKFEHLLAKQMLFV
jgi:hypothetical protein